MFKKQIAAVLAAVLALNLMTACTGSGPKTESATGNTEDAAQAVSTQGTEDPDQVAQVPGTQEDAAGGGRSRRGPDPASRGGHDRRAGVRR